MLEVEDALGARTVPHERVERRQQRRAVPAAHAGGQRVERFGVRVGLVAPALDADRDQAAAFEHRVDLHALQPVVVGEVGAGCDAQPRPGLGDEPRPAVLVVRLLCEQLGGHRALGQLVDAPPAAALTHTTSPTSSRSSSATLAGVQSHHSPPACLPPPSSLVVSGPSSRRRAWIASRTSPARAPPQRSDDRGAPGGGRRTRASRPSAGRTSRATSTRRPAARRSSTRPRPPPAHRAEPRVGHELVRAGEDRDRVELHRAQAPQQRGHAAAAVGGAEDALRAQEQPAGLAGAEIGRPIHGAGCKHPGLVRNLASDNHAGIHPRMLEAIGAANEGHVASYGHDPVSERGAAAVREALGAEDAAVRFVFNGTGANVLAMRAVLRPWEAVVCARSAHVNVDEGGAPERLAGAKLIAVETTDGKLTPELVERQLIRRGDEHYAQPRLVTISQPTEYGTVYSLDEVRALTAHAHDHGLLVHVDGARLPNAAAHLDASLADVVAGVDVLSLGGTKSGMMLGEALVAFDAELAERLTYLRKQTAQLASKMRFIAVQFEALLHDELWREIGRHGNALALRLAEGARAAGVEITQPVQSNAVFALLPHDAIAPMQEERFFYVWDETRGEVRWMLSFDSDPEDVTEFTDALQRVLSNA